MTADLLALDGIHTYRGAAHVLRALSLRVGEGETVCLVGRNGAGKTTTLESAMGLLAVRAGAVRFRSQDITRYPPHRRATLGIGYAPEDCGIFPDLTVTENLQIGRWMAESKGQADSGQAIFPEI